MRILAFLVVLSAFGAEDRARVVMTETRGAVEIEDLVYRNSFKEYDSAYRVCPLKRNAAAAILFVHWLEPNHSTSNRTQFLDEHFLGRQRRLLAAGVDNVGGTRLVPAAGSGERIGSRRPAREPVLRTPWISCSKLRALTRNG